MPAISFVVPAYTVEAYLNACMAAIVDACAPGDQVILVDDGSKDDTGLLCKAWQQRHPELITLLEQHNQGLSAARNHGLRLARGEYVLFMDSDDVVKPEAVTQARAVLASAKPDIMVMDFDWWVPEQDDRRKRSPECSHPKRRLLTDRASFCEQTFRDSLLSACSRLFRRELLNQLGPDVFPVGRSYEEIASVPRLILRAQSLYYLDEVLFDYRIRAGSITQSKTPKHCLELATALSSAIHEVPACQLGPSVEMAANMAAAIVLVRALRDCGSVPGGPYRLYQDVWQSRRTTLSMPLESIIRSLDQSGWHDARKTAKHLKFAHRMPHGYIVSRKLIYGWKRGRQSQA